MLLVPRQLQRHGMTGAVPYYGGRLTPAHIQGLKHPQRPAPPPGSPMLGRSAVPGTPPPPPSGPRPPIRPPAPGAATTPAGVNDALEYLLSAEVLTRAEFDTLRARGRL